MKKLILFFLLLFTVDSFAQQTFFSETVRLRTTPDTLRSETFATSATSLYTVLVVSNDTTVLDTIDVYNITEKGDTVRVAVRNLRTYEDTQFLVLTAKGSIGTGMREYLLLSPSINRVFIRSRNIVAGMKCNFYLRRTRL